MVDCGSRGRLESVPVLISVPAAGSDSLVPTPTLFMCPCQLWVPSVRRPKPARSKLGVPLAFTLDGTSSSSPNLLYSSCLIEHIYVKWTPLSDKPQRIEISKSESDRRVVVMAHHPI